jgi:predicted TIM-barrel fold metal-dependent hydrolase
LMDPLADVPAIDQHAHPLELPPRGLGIDEFRALFTEAQREPGRVGETIFYRWAVRELAEILELGVSEDFPEVEAAVLSVRASDPTGYTRQLMREANLEALLLDTGYGGGGALEEHESLLQSPVFEIARIESVAERLLPEVRSAEELLAAVKEDLSRSEAVGFKTVIAYRGGLAVPLDPSEEELERAFEAEKAAGGTEVRVQQPALLGALLLVALGVAGRTGKPLQVHTGFGDEDLHLPATNPALLKPLLDHPLAAGVRVVVLHAYPYVRQAGWLASLYPNVLLDLSLAIPLTAHAAENVISEALELAPWSQLLYASDGFIGPELFVLGAQRFREALAGVLEDLVGQRFLTVSEAEALAEAVLRGNACTSYAI